MSVKAVPNRELDITERGWQRAYMGVTATINGVENVEIVPARVSCRVRFRVAPDDDMITCDLEHKTVSVPVFASGTDPRAVFFEHETGGQWICSSALSQPHIHLGDQVVMTPPAYYNGGPQ